MILITHCDHPKQKFFQPFVLLFNCYIFPVIINYSTSFVFEPNRHYPLAVSFRNKQKHTHKQNKGNKEEEGETEKILIDMEMDSTVCQLFSLDTLRCIVRKKSRPSPRHASFQKPLQLISMYDRKLSQHQTSSYQIAFKQGHPPHSQFQNKFLFTFDHIKDGNK